MEIRFRETGLYSSPAAVHSTEYASGKDDDGSGVYLKRTPISRAITTSGMGMSVSPMEKMNP
jgi:hypothetical protein